MDTVFFRNLFALMIILGIFTIGYFVLKPIIIFIVLGFILAFIFFPIYKLFVKITKSPTFSASILSLILLLLILVPIWILTPIVIDQSFKIYVSAQQTDFVGVLKTAFPSLFSSEQFSAEIGSSLQIFITNSINALLNSLSKIILNFPKIVLNSLVVFFTFFFALRDKDRIFEYVKTLSPFSKEIEDKLAKSSKDITASVLYGHVVLGLLQGVIMAIGLFLFDVPHAFLLSIVAAVAGVLPMIGPMIVWVPVMIYYFVVGNSFSAIGILVIGLISSNIDNFLRPLFISRRTEMPSAIVLIGTIGGIFLFGIMGFILGPLILAYVIIILEVFRNQNTSKGISSLFKELNIK